PETREMLSTSRAYRELAHEAATFGRKDRKDRVREVMQHRDDEWQEWSERRRAGGKRHGGEEGRAKVVVLLDIRCKSARHGSPIVDNPNIILRLCLSPCGP